MCLKQQLLFTDQINNSRPVSRTQQPIRRQEEATYAHFRYRLICRAISWLINVWQVKHCDITVTSHRLSSPVNGWCGYCSVLVVTTTCSAGTERDVVTPHSEVNIVKLGVAQQHQLYWHACFQSESGTRNRFWCSNSASHVASDRNPVQTPDQHGLWQETGSMNSRLHRVNRENRNQQLDGPETISWLIDNSIGWR